MSFADEIKVGDKLVDYDNIFEVFKIKSEKNGSGDASKIVYFKPFFTNTKNAALECSIPQESFAETNIRKPLNRNKMIEVFAGFKKRIRITETADANELKEMLKKNDPKELVKLLKIVVREKKEKGVISRSKKLVFEQALKRLSREYAFVMRSSQEKAQLKISSALGVE